MSNDFIERADRQSARCVNLLGGLTLQVTSGDQDAVISRFRSRQTASLLAYLAYFLDRTHSRAFLMEMLWPGVPERAQRNSFSVALSSLRSLLEPKSGGAVVVWQPILETDAQTVRLRADAVQTDVSRFEEALSAGDNLTALRLYGGPLLTGFFDDWVLLAAPGLEERFVQAALSQAAQYYQAGEAITARDLLRSALLKAPDSEELQDALRPLLMTVPQARAVTHGDTKSKPSAAPEAISPTTAPAAPLHHVAPLPPTHTRFFGRTDERATLQRLLRDATTPLCRQVTLTGVGGSGKTRLAIEAARDAQEAGGFADVFFVACQEAFDSASLEETIYRSLSPRAAGAEVSKSVSHLQQAAQRLRESLQTDSQRVLLVLDNVEQVPEAAYLADRLLTLVPELTLLVTSRVALRNEAEVLVLVGPLPTEYSMGIQEVATVELPPAVALFLDRALKVRPDLRITAPLLRSVAALCATLDGLPLALEMVAARANLFAPAQMQARLADAATRVQLLSSGRRAVPERHRSLDACLQWSVALLSPGARRLLWLSSLFGQGWTVAAAEALCPELETMEHLQELVEACLIQTGTVHSAERDSTFPETSAQNSDVGGVRFSFLETVRAFAAEQRLEQISSEESDAARQRHADYFAEWAEAKQNRQNCLLEEAANLRLALTTLAERKSPRLGRIAAALCEFWELGGMVSEAVRWLALAIDVCATDDPVLGARLRVDYSRFLFYTGDLDAAEDAARSARSSGLHAGNPAAAARATRFLGHIATYKGNADEAVKTLTSALEAFRAIDDAAGVCETQHTLGVMLICICQFDAGRACLAECAALARARGDLVTALFSEFFVADAYLSEGDYERAAPFYLRIGAEAEQNGHELLLAYARWGEGTRLTETGYPMQGEPLLQKALQHASEHGHRWPTILILESIAYAACARSQWERALLVLGAADALRTAVQFPRTPSYVPRHERHLDRLRAALSPDRFAAHFAAGTTLTLDEAIVYCRTVN